MLFLLAFASIFAQSQSGRGSTPATGGKSNQRPAATPTPEIVAATADAGGFGADDGGEIIRVSTQIVSLPVRVMDKKGRFIGGLTKDNFNVTEDGVDQEVALFSNEHQPFTVALMLDMSYSTTFKITEIQSAAISFIDQLRPQDKVMVVSFDGDVHMLCEATNDRKAIYGAIKATKIDTGTSLYEAVDLVINDRFRKIEGRKAIILFSDGVDTTSRRVSEINNLSDAAELDALVYTIRYDTFADVQALKNKSVTAPPPITAPLPKQGGNPFPFPLPTSASSQGTTEEDYKHAEEYLTQMAERTGGRIYQASTIINLTDSFSRIASELREFYSLSYYPKDERTAGKKTNIKVHVDQPGLVVRTRDGFTGRRKIR